MELKMFDTKNKIAPPYALIDNGYCAFTIIDDAYFDDIKCVNFFYEFGPLEYCISVDFDNNILDISDFDGNEVDISRVRFLSEVEYLELKLEDLENEKINIKNRIDELKKGN